MKEGVGERGMCRRIKEMNENVKGEETCYREVYRRREVSKGRGEKRTTSVNGR